MTALPPMFGGVNTARVVVAVPPAQLWPVLFDRTLWVPDFVRKEAIDGTENQVGERARYTTRAQQGDEATRIEEVLLAEPPNRLVTRLASVENDATYAFAEFRLAERVDGCAIEMSLYWLDLPEVGANWSATVKQREGYLNHTPAALERLTLRIAQAASR